MYSKELIKGTISVIILKLLSDYKKMYGYQITKKVMELSSSKICFKEGSLYPALHKLKERELVDIETVHLGKRVRRYYSLTDKGKAEMEKSIAETKDFLNSINNILS